LIEFRTILIRSPKKKTIHLFLGSLWKFIEGESEGQTATDTNQIENKSIFIHPIDLHLATRGIQGWPKLSIEVFSVNALKQFCPVGVGFAFLPTKPGIHKLKVATWRIAPQSVLDSIREKFFTGGFTLVKKDLIHTGIERYKISTISSGIVEVELSLVFKNFRKYNIVFD
jgi:Ciliary basal body-associated, B9 protein